MALVRFLGREETGDDEPEKDRGDQVNWSAVATIERAIRLSK